MSVLNAAEIIDSVMTLMQDDSDAIRAKILSYLNTTCKYLHSERDWRFLQAYADITLVDLDPIPTVGPYQGIAPYPIDYSRPIEIEGADFVIPGTAKVSAADALKSYTQPKFTEIDEGIAILPKTTGEIRLYYIPVLPEYGATDDIMFPPQALPYIKRAVLTQYYEYDMDERWPTSIGQAKSELDALKRWDNMQKPLPQNRRNGRLR